MEHHHAAGSASAPDPAGSNNPAPRTRSVEVAVFRFPDDHRVQDDPDPAPAHKCYIAVGR
jgi:hypothetical protein